MTVAKDTRKKSSNKSKNIISSTKKTEEKENDFACFDDLIKIIDTLEAEDQVSELFEDQDILTKSYKSLLSLMGRVNSNDELAISFDNDNENENDNGIEEKVMDIMTEFLREGIVDEEDFEDFFVEDEDYSEDDEEELSDYNSISEPEAESESEAVNSETKIKLKKSVKFAMDTTKSKKSSRNLKELEMLMEKVDDESDLDDENYESENENGSGSDKEEISFAEDDEDEEFVKKDMFAEDKIEGTRLSSFEKSQITLKSQIATLETENIETRKPWSLRGEINANQRPSDSLLEEAVEFENLSRPTPQITEERTEEIEEVIKRRIAEEAWDDVERKDGRDLTLLNGMSAANQKSARALLEDVATSGPKRSLTQVYEEETANKLSIGSPENEEVKLKRDELRGLFAKICRHVDGLSGNRFAPKVYAQSDFQIKTLGKK